jgi:hypothetical protein
MFKCSFFKTACITAMLGLSVGNVSAQETLILQASDTACTSSSLECINYKDSICGTPDPDPSQNIGGGYWDQTYFNNTGFNCGSFTLSHDSGKSQYSYWGGFTTGSNGDNRNFGFRNPDGHIGSVNWVQNQWGVMAGSGLDANNDTVKVKPYFIAYWDYFSDGINPDAKSLVISLSDGSSFNPEEVYICNHPWPYYGNINGDGFARPLNQSGDHFDLIIHGVKADNSEVTKIIELAVNEIVGQPPFQEPDWQLITLTSLGSNIKYIYFTMESTDNLIIGDIDYGPNTAVYFCMDKLKVETAAKSPAKAVVSKASVKTAQPVKSVEIADYFPIPSYTGGEVVVYTAKGKEVLRTSVKAGEKVNLSQLPVGEYRLKHGHKHIPIKKIK